MAAQEAARSLCSVYSSPSSSSAKFFSRPKPFLYSLKLLTSISAPPLSQKFISYPPSPILNSPTRRLRFELSCAVQEIVVEEKPEQTQESNQKRKLCVINLPWSLTVVDIKNLFGECGTVTDVEEVSGRSIRIEFAKRFKKPSPPRPTGPQPGETRHKLYVSNLGWKVRSTHLREFFSANFNPVSARVVFDAPSGRSAGYGFVSFATKEEAEEAISSLDGKELMGRPLRLKFSEKNVDDSTNQKEEPDNSEGQPEES